MVTERSSSPFGVSQPSAQASLYPPKLPRRTGVGGFLL